MKMRKLNNKGFTLIELLAVVVILAVVMGIAMTSVLSSMNKSRAGALTDSAMVIANGFNQKYTESLVDGIPNNVYLEEIKKVDSSVTTGYDFSKSGVYYLTDDLANELGISSDTYRLDSAITSVTVAADTDPYEVKKSFVVYDDVAGKFVVCLIANNTGNNFVAANALTYADTDTDVVAKLGPTINGMKFKFIADASETNVMYSCSDGQKSW